MGRLPASNSINSKMCPVCNHSNRHEIELLILSMSASNPSLTLDAIAEAYGVSSQDLRVHALMHTPMSLDFSPESEAALVKAFKNRAEGSTSSPAADADDGAAFDSNIKDRLADKVNLRESDMLLANANEMMTTISTLGRRIRRFASDNSDGSDQRLVAFCSASIVSLYINSSAELRKTIDAIKGLNESINGEHDAGAEGLKALADALKGSSNGD